MAAIRFGIWLSALFVGVSVNLAAQAHEPGFQSEGDELEDLLPRIQPNATCKKATKAQKAVVESGNKLAPQFYQACMAATQSDFWCQQVMRPNPESVDVFQCTYGPTQIHQLIDPDKSTWPNAFRAVQLVAALEKTGIKPCLIYNWWRPEPYNKNVGGAPGRHPKGTSVDVRFCSMPDMEKAFTTLCDWRAKGQLRALGYYGTTGLHLGVGDSRSNTWGKACP